MNVLGLFFFFWISKGQRQSDSSNGGLPTSKDMPLTVLSCGFLPFDYLGPEGILVETCSNSLRLRFAVWKLCCPGCLSFGERSDPENRTHAAVGAVSPGISQRFYSSRPDVIQRVDKKRGHEVKCRLSRSIFKLSPLIRAMDAAIHSRGRYWSGNRF